MINNVWCLSRCPLTNLWPRFCEGSSVLQKFKGQKRRSRSDSMGVAAVGWWGGGGITVPGATAFLEWKFINNAGLDNKKNSPAVSHCTALSKGRAISLKSQKKTNYETSIFFPCWFLDSGQCVLWTDEPNPRRNSSLCLNCRFWYTEIMTGLQAKLLTSFFFFWFFFYISKWPYAPSA